MAEEQKKWVYGTRTKGWYLVGKEDRDFETGISRELFKELGEEAARNLYLNN